MIPSNTSVAIVVAIVALVATIVGAIIGALTNYLIAVRRERADEEKENLIRAIELKRAARLIHAELALGEEVLMMAIKDNNPSFKILGNLTGAWDKHSEIIAAEVSDDVWCQVVEGHGALNYLTHTRDLPGMTAYASAYASWLKHIESGRKALEDYVFPEACLPAKGNKPIWRWWKNSLKE
jgi:hypothetical protein